MPKVDHFQSAQCRLFIKGGKVVNDDQSFYADVYIEDGIIKQVGTNLVIPGGARTIDAKGKLVIPGGIDTHTHMQLLLLGNLPAGDIYHGTKAALAGGTTLIMEFVMPQKGESLLEAYDKCRNLADDKVCCDYCLHGVLTSWDESVSDEMEILVTEKGINSFAMTMSSIFMLNDTELYKAFQRCSALGAIPLVHAENGHVIEMKTEEVFNRGITGPEGHEMSRPEEGEAEAASRAIMLATEANCPILILTVTSKSCADTVADRRRQGKVVFSEVTAAALGTDGSHCYNKDWRHAAAYINVPPLRSDKATPQHLMDHLANDGIQVTASDDFTLNADQRALGKDDFRRIPPGVNGVEERMSIIWEKGVVSGKLDPRRFVAVTSTNAAKLFNIYPKKGRIAVGSDADIVVWDPEATRTFSQKTHHSVCDFNIFEGMICHGVPLYVISGGRVMLDEDGLHVTQGVGRFVPTPANAEIAFSKIHARAKQIPKPVKRIPYEGTVLNASERPSPSKYADNPVIPAEDSGHFYMRPATRGGGRNLQDSSFSLGGEQIDEKSPRRPGTRVKCPPGGQSSGLW